MEPTNAQIGRTIPDLLLHYLRSPASILLTTAAIAIVAVVISIAGWAVADASAKPGTEIKLLWGMFAYTKTGEAQQLTETSVAAQAVESRITLSSSESSLPKAGSFGGGWTDINVGTKILDGTIAISGMTKAIVLTGLGLQEIDIAAMDWMSDPIEPRRRTDLAESGVRATSIYLEGCVGNCIIELRYKGKNWRIRIEDEKRIHDSLEKKATYAVVQPISTTTMNLVSFSSLRNQ